jgi:murein DD-endopeptidase MepM/ murein hydrolase activator NlpD
MGLVSIPLEIHRNAMRRFIPIVIVLAALAVYTEKDTLLSPLRMGSSSIDPSDRGGADAETPDGPLSATTGSGLGRPAEISGEHNVVHGKISRGTPFFVEMQRAGVTPLEIQNIVQATRERFNFKKVKPGQEYSLYSDSDGGLDSLKFVVDSENVLNITKTGDTYQTRIDTIPYRIDHYVTCGDIEQSIYVSLQEFGADPELASYLAVIFQWDIDFFKDIRRGDTFSILYEQKTYEDGRTQLGNVLAARICSQGREHYAFRYTAEDGNHSYYDEKGKSLQKSLLRAPLRYSRVSSSFSYRRFHPVKKHYAPHLGVDYAAPTGTPVRTTGDGTVLVATRNASNGKYVKIRHNSRYTTYYLHLSGFAKGIRKGARVRQGQVIGYVGATGIATGPHLDYRIKVGNRFVNPRTVRLPSKRPVPSAQMTMYRVLMRSYLFDLFDPSLDDETVLVEKPAPVIRQRMQAVF